MAIPATSATAALTSAPRRTFAQNSLRASTRKATAATWKASPIISPLSCIQVSSPVTMSPTFQPIERDHVEDEDQPGEPFAGRQRGGQQRQHERPREAGVGEVEDVVVDELPRDP